MLEAVHKAAARQPDFHLVDDDHDAVPAAALLQRLEEVRRRHDQPAIGHQRLDEHRRDLIRRAGRLELEVEHGQHVLGAETRAIRVGVGQEQDARPWQRVRHRSVAADAHRAGEVAVIGADEGDEARAAGRRGKDAHGAVVGVGARMAEPDAPFVLSGRDLQELFGQRDGRLVRVEQQAGSSHVADRFLHRLDNRRMTVAEDRRPGGARKVEHRATTFLDQPVALAAHQRQRRKPQPPDLGDDARIALAQGRAAHAATSLARTGRTEASLPVHSATPLSPAMRSCLISISTAGMPRSSPWIGTA